MDHFSYPPRTVEAPEFAILLLTNGCALRPETKAEFSNPVRSDLLRGSQQGPSLPP